MSMELKCTYEEKFTSQVTGQTLTFRDELYLLRVWDPHCWTILAAQTHDAKNPLAEEQHGTENTNREIYKRYLTKIQKLHQNKTNKLIRTYSQEDNLLLIQGKATRETLTPIKSEQWIEIHKEACEEWFEKYGGIENVRWEVQ